MLRGMDPGFPRSRNFSVASHLINRRASFFQNRIACHTLERFVTETATRAFTPQYLSIGRVDKSSEPGNASTPTEPAKRCILRIRQLVRNQKLYGCEFQMSSDPASTPGRARKDRKFRLTGLESLHSSK